MCFIPVQFRANDCTILKAHMRVAFHFMPLTVKFAQSTNASNSATLCDHFYVDDARDEVKVHGDLL